MLNPIGTLETREWAEASDKERQALRLPVAQVEKIAQKHDKIAPYLNTHPKARLNAVFSKRHSF